MVWWWISAAWACSLAGPQDFEATATGEPVGEPPVAAVLREVSISRGSAGVRQPDGSIQSTSCDDLGIVSIGLEDPGPGFGFRLQLDGGTLPDSVTAIHEDAQVGDTFSGGRSAWVVSWIDEETDDQEPFDFDVIVTVVDGWGRESEPLTVNVSDPGSTATPASSCSTVPGAAGLALSLLALAARRRRLLTGS